MLLMGVIVFATSGCGAQINPIRCFVTGAQKPFGIDKGLNIIEWMMIMGQPVG